jgi:hypothetical protein
MTASGRLAAILAADVGVREHWDGGFENRANGSFTREIGQGHQAGTKPRAVAAGRWALISNRPRPISL